MSTYRVLAFDGGGIRGVLSAALVEHLQQDVRDRTGVDFLDKVDLFAGSSIGTANAFAFALGHTPQDVVGFFQREAPRIFSKRARPSGVLGSIIRVISHIPGIRSLIQDVNLLFLPKWDTRPFHKAVNEYFGNKTFADLGERKVAASAINVDAPWNGSHQKFTIPVIMDSYSPENEDLRAADVVMRSGAIPMGFESFGNFVDGGLFANNPSTLALATALDPDKGGQTVKSVRVMSIGTGVTPNGIGDPKPLRWGMVKWVPKLYDVSSNAVGEFDSLQARSIIGDSYTRLNPVLKKPIASDDYQKVPKLLEIAHETRDTEPYRKAVDFLASEFVDA